VPLVVGSVTFGIALVAAAAAFFTPETKGTALADLGKSDPIIQHSPNADANA
jgi:hypothetical protein